MQRVGFWMDHASEGCGHAGFNGGAQWESWGLVLPIMSAQAFQTRHRWLCEGLV